LRGGGEVYVFIKVVLSPFESGELFFASFYSADANGDTVGGSVMRSTRSIKIDGDFDDVAP
jgi:hypothetical protein